MRMKRNIFILELELLAQNRKGKNGEKVPFFGSLYRVGIELAVIRIKLLKEAIY